MTALNGQSAPQPPPNPAPAIAEAVWTACMDEGDLPWPDLSSDEREYLTDHAEAYIAGHCAWLTQHGFRILPPGAAIVPKSDEEAAAMLLAVKSYKDSKKRKGGLLTQDRKLILPPGSKLQ